jgi:hypothetical protein
MKLYDARIRDAQDAVSQVAGGTDLPGNRHKSAPSRSACDREDSGRLDGTTMSVLESAVEQARDDGSRSSAIMVV